MKEARPYQGVLLHTTEALQEATTEDHQAATTEATRHQAVHQATEAVAEATVEAAEATAEAVLVPAEVTAGAAHQEAQDDRNVSIK